MFSKIISALLLTTAASTVLAFPGPSGSFQQSGAHGGSIQGTRTTTATSAQSQGSITGANGNGVSAEASSQKSKGGKTSYTGTATTTGGKSATATDRKSVV